MLVKRSILAINLTIVGALLVLMVLTEAVLSIRAATSSAATSVTGTPQFTFGGPVALTYEPAMLVVKAGSSVVWQGPLTEHPLMSVDGLWQRQASGTSFSHTFTQPGTYRFYCQFHGGPNGGMMGRVVVE